MNFYNLLVYILLLLSNKYDCQSIIVAIVWATSCSKGNRGSLNKEQAPYFLWGLYPWHAPGTPRAPYKMAASPCITWE